MRFAALLPAYLGAVFLGGALLAPMLYWMTQSAVEHLPALREIAYQPFHRYVNRCFLILAIIGLWPLAKFAHLSRHEVGWLPARDWRKLLLTGLAVGFASLALPALGAVLAGGRQWFWPGELSLTLRHLGNALGAAVVVSVLEETVFRGVLFSVLRKHGPGWSSVIFSSAIFALVHFFERSEHTGEVRWNSGLALLPLMLRGFGAWDQLVPGFFSLFVAGIILARAFQLSGSLYVSLGVHAGWIFWLKTFNFFTRETAAGASWFWGAGRLTDGWAALAVLLAGWWGLERAGYFATGSSARKEEPDGDSRSR